MKVSKVADIVEGEVMLTVTGRAVADLAAILTNMREPEDANRDFQWHLEIVIGQGPSARAVRVPLQTPISTRDSLNEPLLLADGTLLFFRNRLFRAERSPRTPSEREEVGLRVKKAVYDEDNELAALRSAVANCEAAAAYTKSGARREPLPDDVKLLVWARDGGSCVRCGSKQALHFDHVIPVAKGGGNLAENVQLLCQLCNLRKSDKIAT